MSLVVAYCVLLLAIIGHGYFWIDGVNRLHAWAGPRFLIDYPTYAAILAFVAMPLLIAWDWWQTSLGWPSYVWSQPGILPRYLQFCAFWAVAKLALNQNHKRKVNNPQVLLSWRQEESKLLSPGNPLPVCDLATHILARLPGNECLKMMVDYKRLAIPRIHPNHAGVKIAHISDLHMIGRIEQKWFEAVVDRINQLEPEVILITGDILERELCLQWLPETLGRLRAKYGVYFILGNHDLFVDCQRTIEILTDSGLTYVGGQWIETQWNETPVLIAGNERPWRGDELDSQQIPARAADQLPLKIILAHSPDQFAWSCRQDADLVLAGHTHGGQIRFPLLGAVACPSLHGTRYSCGAFRTGNTVMHVTRGISGERPIRWNCPPEIALLELAKG